jgi:uncharacterized protein
MIVDFREIPVTGLDVEADTGIQWLDDQSSDALRRLYTFSGPFRISVHLERTKESVFISGEYTGEAAIECVRCLSKTTIPLRNTFRLTMLPHKHEESKESETELEADDVDLVFYDEERVDLDKVIAEQVILSLDLYPRCRPDCKGLCQQCGKNLNESSCSCGDGGGDSRWAALKQLKLA